MRNIEHSGSLSWLKHLTTEVIMSFFCPECQHNCLFFVPQVSARPQKTSPTRSKTCGQSAAQTLEGRTLWPVQMGRSQVTVGECHIPARLAQPSVQCLYGQSSTSQNYQSLSLLQLPPSSITALCNCYSKLSWRVNCSLLAYQIKLGGLTFF